MKALTHIWTFLTKPRGPGARKPRPRRRQRGIALITVLIAIGFSLILTNQFGTTTNVDMMAAANYRDSMRAHFLARSAQNVAELVIRVQQRFDNSQQFKGAQVTDFADMALMALCGTPEELQGLIGAAADSATGLGAIVGTCGVVGQIATEDDKINLNCANSTSANAATLKSALDALVYFPAYDPVFEEPDAEGYRRDRATQVASLIDYIDNNTSRLQERGTTEAYGYESLKDPYKPKNNYVDTIGELKLARGVDDRFWSLFGDAFTIYGGCKINMSAVSNSQLIAAILFLSAKNPNDPILANPQKLFTMATLAAKAKLFGIPFRDLDDFIDFAKAPCDAMPISPDTGSANSGGQDLCSQALPRGEKLSLELDKAKLSQIASAGPRRTYRVEAWGEIDRKQGVFPAIRKTITGIWDTKVVNQNARKPPAPKGAWVFLRED